MYVETCCADRQMPAILKGNEVFFNTSGDITVQHIMKAVSYLAGKDIEFTLMIDTLSDDLLSIIRHYVNREWFTKINLFVKTDCKKQIKTAFDGMTTIIDYAVDENLNDNFISFKGSDGAVLILGKMLLETKEGFYTYAGRHFKSNSAFDEMIAPFNAKFKSKNKKL